MHLPRPHSRFPFITIGKYLDPDFSHEKDGPSQKNNDHGWCFTIDSIYGYGTYRTKNEAIIAAEKELFSEHGEFARSQLKIAIENNNVSLALALAERRGYWLGATQRQKETAKIIKVALKNLMPLSKT
ncbi:hypothetical protein HP062_16505 [Pseudomonas sp. B14-6]|uniref:hypothetical protein n=1 Tax=Pseudomonas sp. B14-6 TaxID=2738843 RepID=UPI00155DED04|nr:hypothetical protein [Pseudomonas sp. B14-6]QKG67050.1 hypothetical protein HP062_16505 [Pseudomonas sp. B14-6]